MRRQKTLMGLLVVVVLIGILSLIRTQPWGKLRLRFWQPSTEGWIVCVQRTDGQGDLAIIKPDGSLLMLAPSEADETSPDWSPDGGRIVFSSNRKENVYQLFLVDPDGKYLQQLTIGGGAKQEPLFHRDGDHILYVAQGLVTEIDPKGEHAEQLLPPPEHIEMERWRQDLGIISFRYARWSADDRLLAAVQKLDVGEAGIWYHVEPTAEQQAPPGGLIMGKHVDLDWHPNELKLVVSVAQAIEPGTEKPLDRSALFVADFSEINFSDPNSPREPKPIPLWASSDRTQAVIQPLWSPDGVRIAYVRCRIEKEGHLVRTGLMVIPSDGGVPVELVAGEVYDPHWAPDSRRIVYTMGSPGNRQVYTVDLDSGESKPLTPEGDYVMPKFSPRG